MLNENSRTAPRSLFKASCFIRIAAGIFNPPKEPEEEEIVALVVPPVKLFLRVIPTAEPPLTKSSAVELPAIRPSEALIPGDILPDGASSLLVSGGATVFMELAAESDNGAELLADRSDPESSPC